MPGIIPFIPLIAGIGGMIAQNGQNKSAQQNADNAAASGRQNNDQALQAALQRQAAFQSANPNPAAQYAQVKGPGSVYGGGGPTMGGQQFGANGMPTAPPPPAAGQGMDAQGLMPMLMAMLQAQGGQQPPGPPPGPPPAAIAPAPAPPAAPPAAPPFVPRTGVAPIFGGAHLGYNDFYNQGPRQVMLGGGE